MKIISIYLLLVLAITATWAAGISPGDQAPNFSVKDIHGKTHHLTNYLGKIVVIEAFNPDCPFSAHHYKSGAMPELQDQLKGRGVIWLTVNSTQPKHGSYRKPSEAIQESKSLKMKSAAWIDDSSGTLGRAYGLTVTPHLVVIDARGKVAYHGAIDDQPEDSGDPRKARNYVREAVQQLLAGEKVKVPQTKPYGCAIKYGN